MKNGLDDVDGSVQPPPPKRIKLEEDSTTDAALLSKKRLGKGGQRKLPKSTLEERALILLNDDRISAVEPQQVLCRMCGHWVKLFKHTDYSPANWRTHAEKCEPRTAWKARVQAEPGDAFTLTIPSLTPAMLVPPEAPTSISSPPLPPPSTSPISKLPNATSSTVSSPQLKELLNPGPGEKPTHRRPTKTTVERQSALENDSRCKEPGAHVVLCKMCGQWVKLHNTREYDLWNWLRHAEKCEVKNGWVLSNSAALQTLAPVSGAGRLEGNCFLSSASAPVASETIVVQPSPQHVEKGLDVSTTQITSMDASANHGSRHASILASDRSLSKNPPIPSDTRLNTDLSLTQHRGSDTFQPADSGLQSVGLAFTPISSLDKPEDLHASSELGIREGQTDQRALATKLLGDQLNSADTDGSVPEIVLDQAVKYEPQDVCDLFYPDPELGPTEDGLSNSFSASGSFSAGTKRRKGRNAEERKQALVNDPRTGDVLPNEVFCKMCNKWIKLYKEVDYVESNWIRHAERCSARQVAKQRLVSPRTTLSISDKAGGRGARDARRGTKGTDQRQEELRADSRITAIEPHQVLCGVCDQWIKLQSYKEYDVWNWRKHISLCQQRSTGILEDNSTLPSDLRATATLQIEPDRSSLNVEPEQPQAGPSSAPALVIHLTAPPKLTSSAKLKDESTSEERRAELERDGRCENVEPQHVTCKLCNRTVGLHVKKDYSLSNWYRHISSCGKRIDKPMKPPIRTPLSAIGASRPPIVPSNASTSIYTVPVSVPNQPGSITADFTSMTPDAAIDSVVSAPSHINMPKMRKSTAEDRRAKLLGDPRVGALEPNRIQCKLCQHWLKLNEFMEYAPYNWYKHIERCEMRKSLNNQGSTEAPIVVKEEEHSNLEVVTVPETTDSAEPGVRKRSTATERLARMQADPRIKTIEKHRARCGLCDRWVKLQNKTEYDPHNWFAHVKKCALRSGAPELTAPIVADTPGTYETSPTVNGDSDTPSFVVERSGIVDRRSLLLNDSRSAAVEPHRVLCGICQQWIKLRDGKEYVPYNWFKHKRKCERRNGLPQTPTLSITGNEDKSPVTTPIKDVVKKEPSSIDMSLYSNDIRKMTDEEREAQLRADPRLGDVEPGRVFCKMCNSWIRLNMATGFLRGNWLRHAERCKGKSHWEGKAPETQEGPPELRPVEIIDLDDSESLGHGHFGYIELGRLIGKFEPTISSIDYGKPPETKAAPVLKQQPTWSIPNLRARTNTPTRNGSVPLPQSTSEPKMSDTGKRMHRSEESRKLELENDDRTKIVQPDKILCAMCDRWIQMRRDVSYSPQNWLKHAGICEQRTGWLKRNKAGKPENNESVSKPVTREPSEDPVPYNARVRAKERSALDAPPALKPVDWDQIVGSDDDDDDDDENTMADVGLSADTLPSSKHNISSVKTSASTTTGPESPSQRLAIPTPLTSLRASKAETKTLPTSSSTSPGVRIPPSSSPPMVGPFTTVPLSFYRPTYPQHVVQHGYNSSKDGIPVKGASPHNGGGAQRPVPFVVPHLLPRPVLVPISHAAGQRSAIPSPFRLPATPPLPPPVGIAKTNTPMLTPPPTAPMTNGAASPASANPAQLAQVPTEASGVAVPTPVRSALERPTIANDAAALDKSPPSPPANSGGKPLPRKSSYGPVGPGVLQLAPESSTKRDPPTAQQDIMSPPPTAGVTNKEMSVPSESLPSEHLEMHPITGTGQEAMSAEA